jgi:maltose O-acetyltransferase
MRLPLPNRVGAHVVWRLDMWRQRQLAASLGHLGEGSWLGAHVIVYSPQHLMVGDHSEINDFTLIFALGGVEIGSHVLISAGCNITSVTHPQDPAARRSGCLQQAPVRICDGAWLGAGVIVLPGVTVGADAIVGAGAVVSRDVAPTSTVVGVPARPLKQGTRARP